MRNTEMPGKPRRVSRQREAGEATRRETRRLVLTAATDEFAERGYAAATVNRIAARAGVAVQTVYSAWGSKRALLHAVMESVVTGDDAGFPTDQLPLAMITPLHSAGDTDPRLLLEHLARGFRLIAERAQTSWRTYRDGAAVDPDIAADWQQLQQYRRADIAATLQLLPDGCLHPDLDLAGAIDTTWIVTSPDTHDMLVHRQHYTYDQLELWVRRTLIAALLPEPTAAGR